MTLFVADRVFETTTSTGTGSITLAGAAATGYRSFVSAGATGKKVPYVIDSGANWECGIGTISSGPDTLSRDTILSSSNANAAVNFGAGTKNVRLASIAEIANFFDENLVSTYGFGGDFGGTANALTIDITPTPLALENGLEVWGYAANANTSTSVTLNVNSLGAKNIKVRGSNPASGDIQADDLLGFRYRESDDTWEWINKPVSVTGLTPASFADQMVFQHGQCQLVNSSGTVKLIPFNGQYIITNGVPCKIPSSGVSASLTGKSANTTDWYNVYAYMNSGTMTLELGASGTYSHGTDPATGVEVKKTIAGGALDTTRTFVGMIWLSATATLGSGAADIASYFNRTKKVVSGTLTNGRTYASSTPGEINSEIRTAFLTFDGGDASYNGTLKPSGNTVGAALIYLDGSTKVSGGTAGVGSAVPDSICNSGNPFTASEGRHYMTLFGYASGGTTTYAADATTNRGVLTVSVNA